MANHVVKAHDSGANVLHFNNGFSLAGRERFGSAKKHPSSCNCASSLNFFMVKKIKGFDGLSCGEDVGISVRMGCILIMGFHWVVRKGLVQLKSILLHATALAVLISSW